MSVRLINDEHYRTTNHSDEIQAMRDKAMEIVRNYPVEPGKRVTTEKFQEATILMAAAELLACHDDTGISLDNWTGPRELVELGLMIAGYDSDVVFLESGV